MSQTNQELEFHARISERIFQTLDEISEEGEDGNITTCTAKRIIRMVRNFNFTREVLIQRLQSEMITRGEFRMQLNREGRKCIDSINRIMAESSAATAV